MKLLNERQQLILRFVHDLPETHTDEIREFLRETAKPVSRITVVRDLNVLLAGTYITRVGAGRGTCYREIDHRVSPSSESQLPSFFGPLLWSYDITRIDPDTDHQTIIRAAILYGELKHWKWIVHHYGKAHVRSVIRSFRDSELRPSLRALIATVFSIKQFNHAPRST